VGKREGRQRLDSDLINDDAATTTNRLRGDIHTDSNDDRGEQKVDDCGRGRRCDDGRRPP
jgi:hypothetical protein